MRVTVNGHTYVVVWQHVAPQPPNKMSADPVFTHASTTCFIKEVKPDDSLETLRIQTAHCNPKDNFDKNRGRKLSLFRALAAAQLPKEARTKFWEKYFEMRGGKW